MRVVRLENAVHDTPVDIGADTVKRDIQLLSNAACSSITANEKLGPNDLFYSSLRILNGCSHGVGRRRVALDFKPSDGGASFHQLLVA